MARLRQSLARFSALFLFSAMFTVSCGPQSYRPESKTLVRASYISSNSVPTYAAPILDKRGYQAYGALVDATFEQVKGMKADQAVAFLESDGAVCENMTCRWTSLQVEPAVCLVWGCLRPPGPLRNMTTIREVTFLTSVVSSKSDLMAWFGTSTSARFLH
jgi:hypothetical protein